MTAQDSVSAINQLLDALNRERNAIANAKTPVELNAARGRAESIMRQITGQWASIEADLKGELKRSFERSGGTGPIDRRYREKAARSIAKARSAYLKNVGSGESWLGKYIEDEQRLKARGAYRDQINKLKRIGAPAEEIAKTQKLLDSIPRKAQVGADAVVRYKGSKGHPGRNVPMDHYLRMSVNTSHAILRNLGTIAAADQKSKYVIVSDGPECGMTSHKDMNKANGAVWHVDEAFANPLAHPSCQRQFFVANGPKGSKKLRDQLNALGMSAAERKRKTKVQTFAEIIAGVSMVASISGAVITNPFMRRFMREMLADQALFMHPLVQKALTQLTSYAKKEAAAFAAHGKRLGIADQQQFDEYILKSFDDDLADLDFLSLSRSAKVTIRTEQAQVLGVPYRLEKGRLMAALDDYGDWVSHKSSIVRTLEDQIASVRIMSGAKEELHAAATRFYIEKAPGVQLERNWARVMQDLKKTYEAAPDKAQVDAIRLLASVVDPSPWLGVKLPGAFRFTVGMPSFARQDLAEKLFLKITNRGVLTAKEVEWAQALGMDLTDLQQVRFEVQDLWDVLAPRLSFLPGGPFHATLGIESGVLRPIIRLYPNGTVGRLISLEQRLGQVDVQEFIRQMRRVDTGGTLPERIYEALADSMADADMVTSLNLFRNSPVELSLKLMGASPESWAIRLLPDNKFLKYSYKFSFNNLAYYRNLKLEDLQPIAQARKISIDGKNKAELIKSLQRWDDLQRRKFMKELTTAIKGGGSVADVVGKMDPELYRSFYSYFDGWEKGLNILPNRLLQFQLDGLSMGQRDAILRLRAAGYSLLEISKNTRYGYDSLLKMWAESRQLFERIKQFSPQELRDITSWKELVERITIPIRRKVSNIDNLSLKNVSLDFADERLLTNKALETDLKRFRAAWERMFPDIDVPKVKLAETLSNPLEFKDGVIWIDRYVAEEWEEYAFMRRRSVSIGHFPRNTNDSVATLLHEGAHALVDGLTNEDKRRIMVRIYNSYSTWAYTPKGFSLAELKAWSRIPEIEQELAYRVSAYGTHDIDELFSEAFSEFMVSREPRSIAAEVGKALLEKSNGYPISLTLRERKLLSKVEYAWEAPGTSIKDVQFRLLSVQQKLESYIRAEADRLYHSKQLRTSDLYKYDPHFVELKEGLFIDENLLKHPIYGTDEDLINDIIWAFDRFKKEFPGFDFPNVSLMPLDENMTAFSDFMSYALHNKANGFMYIPESRLFAKEFFDEMIAIGNRLDYFAGSGPNMHKYTMLHEAGHSMHWSLPYLQHKKMIEMLFERAIQYVPMTGMNKYQLENLLREFKMTSLKGGTYVDDHLILDGAVEGITLSGGISDHFQTIFDLITGIAPSEYGMTNFQEFIAELITRGWRLILEGKPPMQFSNEDKLAYELMVMLKSFGKLPIPGVMRDLDPWG